MFVLKLSHTMRMNGTDQRQTDAAYFRLKSLKRITNKSNFCFYRNLTAGVMLAVFFYDGIFDRKLTELN
jgi:hypothetical protein